MDLDCALRNITSYEEVFSAVILERNFLEFNNPNFATCQAHSTLHHSHGTLPYLLTEGTGSQTVLEFLTDTWEDVVSENLEELKCVLMPVADLFNEEQLNLTYKRLRNLRNLIQSFKQNKVI